MNRNELIKELQKNFDIRELVCPHCYAKFGESSWQFISTELLSTLYQLRYEIFKQPIIINNWHRGGKYNERGLRCNMCSLVQEKDSVYLSAHCLGKAIDFNVGTLTAKEISQIIKSNKHIFNYPIRLERDTNGWSHVDTYQKFNSNVKLVEFNS